MLGNIRLVGYGRDVCKATKKSVNTIPQYHMIHFVESGYGYYNGHHLRGGDAFICKRDEFCRYFPDQKEPWTYTWINVQGEGADALITRLVGKNNVFRWRRSAHLEALEKICHYQNSADAEELICISALYRICSDVIASKGSEQRDYIVEAKRLFQSGFDRSITVEMVAGTLGISRAYLRNIFYEKTGQSPQRYLMELRMRRAETLLSGRYSITEIAAAVGYQDVLQFSKIFMKYHGCSPTDYRKRLPASKND